MCQLPCDSSQQCNGGMCNGSGVPCSTNQTKSGSNDIAPRQDYPCNYRNGGGLSYTAYYWDNHNGRILKRATTYKWTWTNRNATFGIYNSYVGPSHCLFNLNNVNTCDYQGNAADAITKMSPFNFHWTIRTGRLSTMSKTATIRWLTESTWQLTRSSANTTTTIQEALTFYI